MTHHRSAVHTYVNGKKRKQIASSWYWDYSNPKKTNRGAQYQCSFDSACQLPLRCTLTRVRSIFMALLLPGTHVLPTTETKMEDAIVDHLEFVHVNTSPGDCIVFSAWLLHRSRANRTASRDRSMYYVTYGNKGGLQEGVGSNNNGGGGGGAERSGDVCGQSLYDAYYELYDAWIAAGYVKGQAADALLGQTRLRPSLIPTSAMGINPPSNRG